jgi:hypothetical protein
MVQNAFRAEFAARFRRANFDFHKLFNTTVENFRTLYTEQTSSGVDSANELHSFEPTCYFRRAGTPVPHRGNRSHTMKLRQRADVHDRDMIYLRPARYRPQ